MSGFVFNDTQSSLAAALAQTGLADETAGAGMQSEAAGLPVLPPGHDPGSVAAAGGIKAYTSQVAAQLAAGAQLQSAYSQATAHATNGYILIDELHAAGIGTASAPELSI